MYACRIFGDVSQKELAEAFELKHPGSAAFSINKIRREVEEGHWLKAFTWLEKQLDIVK